jgi:hypothetical protein
MLSLQGFMDQHFPQIDAMVTFNALGPIIGLLSLSKPETFTDHLNKAILGRVDTKGYFSQSETKLVDSFNKTENRGKIYDAIVKNFFANLTRDSLSPILKMLWFSKLPCFDVPNLTGSFPGENTFLKYCSWKGREGYLMQLSGLYNILQSILAIIRLISLEVA